MGLLWHCGNSLSILLPSILRYCFLLSLLPSRHLEEQIKVSLSTPAFLELERISSMRLSTAAILDLERISSTGSAEPTSWISTSVSSRPSSLASVRSRLLMVVTVTVWLGWSYWTLSVVSVTPSSKSSSSLSVEPTDVDKQEVERHVFTEQTFQHRV